MTEIIFAVLFVSLMGLTRCYKTTVFTFICGNIRHFSVSTDARCLAIKLGVQCDMVDFVLNSVARSIGVSKYTCLSLDDVGVDTGLATLTVSSVLCITFRPTNNDEFAS